MKTHYMTKTGRACHLTSVGRNTDNTFAVTCGFCMKKPEFKAAEDAALIAKQEAFDAQVPSMVREPWKAGAMKCSECGHERFRHGDRTCYGHYDNWHCAACGHVESRLTETGMSF
jgi:hypothetical protein